MPELGISFFPLMRQSFMYFTLCRCLIQWAGGAEFKSVHLHELPTYGNLAEVSLKKKYINLSLLHLEYECSQTDDINN